MMAYFADVVRQCLQTGHWIVTVALHLPTLASVTYRPVSFLQWEHLILRISGGLEIGLIRHLLREIETRHDLVQRFETTSSLQILVVVRLM